MARITRIFIFLSLSIALLYPEYEVQIRDITYFKGIKKNIISGYGLVVGIDGTGDSRTALTKKTINQYLAHSGIDIDESKLVTRNSAVVAVTAEVNGFIEKGDLLDVNVASIGDAKSIDNGLLLQTVLRAPNGQVYIVAGGVVDSGSAEDNNKRRGVITSGGIVEKPAGSTADYSSGSQMILVLKDPSIANISLLKEAIENADPELKAEIRDYKQLVITAANGGKLPYKNIAAMLEVKVKLKSRAKVVIDKQSGIVVVGDTVRVDSAFISLPGINVRIDGDKDLNNIIKNNNTVSELASEFNNIGIQPGDIIAVFQALKKCGAINADILVQ